MMGHDYAHCEDYDEATCPQICFRGQLVQDYRNRVHTDMQGVPVSWMHLRGTTECQLNKPKRTNGDRIRAMTDEERKKGCCMTDYISREWLLAEYDRRHKGPPGGARKIIETAPAADVKPVVRGKWIEKPYLIGTSQFCSKCGSNYGMPHEIYNYCPNCGADMRGVADDGGE